MNLRNQAQQVQSAGRFGDSVLMHVNPVEAQALARLSPTGTLTRNPETGQPEAFLPMLGAIAGPALLGTGAVGSGLLGLGLSSALSSGIGAGLGAFLESGDLSKGLMTGLTGWGLGSLLGSLTGSGEVSKGIEGVKPEMTTDASGWATSGNQFDTLANPMAQATNPASGMTDVGGDWATNFMTPANASAYATPASPVLSSQPPLTPVPPTPNGMSGASMSPQLSQGVAPDWAGDPQRLVPQNGIGQPIAPEPQAALPEPKLLGEAMAEPKQNWMQRNADLIKWGGLGLGALSYLDQGQEFDPPGRTNKRNIPESFPEPDDYRAVFPDWDYRAGANPEWNYFPYRRYGRAEGGIVGLAEGGAVPPPSIPTGGNMTKGQPSKGSPMSLRPSPYAGIPTPPPPPTVAQRTPVPPSGGGVGGSYSPGYRPVTTGYRPAGLSYGSGYNPAAFEYTRFRPTLPPSVPNVPSPGPGPTDPGTDPGTGGGTNPTSPTDPVLTDRFSPPTTDPGRDREWYWNRNDQIWDKRRERDAAGGRVGRLQAGGIAGLAPNPAADRGGYVQESGPQDQMSEEEMRIVSEAKMALMGSHPDPQAAIDTFVKVFGEGALDALMSQVRMESEGQGRMVNGPGAGMDDAIPARIDGQQEAALSDGEYVVPADVVSGLGDGSTGAGAKRLDDMLARVRMNRTGSPEQPGKIKEQEAMPA